MNWADIAILTIVGVSALISLFRGFVSEVLSLVAWVVAFWVAFTFTDVVANLLVEQIALDSLRYLVAFIALLIIALLIVGVINHLIGKLLDKTGLTATDRVLGVIFGLVRGIAVVGVIVFLAGLTPVPKDSWWRESNLMPHFEQLALFAIDFLPPDFRTRFSYQ